MDRPLDEFGLLESVSEISSPEPRKKDVQNPVVLTQPHSKCQTGASTVNQESGSDATTMGSKSTPSCTNTSEFSPRRAAEAGPITINDTPLISGSQEYYQAAANYLHQLSQSQESHHPIPFSRNNRIEKIVDANSVSNLKLKINLKGITNKAQTRILNEPTKENEQSGRIPANNHDSNSAVTATQHEVDDELSDVSIGEIEKGIILKTLSQGSRTSQQTQLLTDAQDNSTQTQSSSAIPIQSLINTTSVNEHYEQTVSQTTSEVSNNNSIKVLKSSTSFHVTILFEPERRHLLKPENLASLKKVATPKSSPKKAPPKPRTKMKKRPKHHLSRFMIKSKPLTKNDLIIKIIQKQLGFTTASFSEGAMKINLLKNKLTFPLSPTAVQQYSNKSIYKGFNDEVKFRQVLFYEAEAKMKSELNDASSDDELIEKYVRLSLKDPLSGSRLQTPVRSRLCSHIECFDYESFLAMNNLKPFRIAVRRYTDQPAKVGEVNVLNILEDSKRVFINSKEYNKETVDFEYKNKLKYLKQQSKFANEVEWFSCPICRLEFNIKEMGDVYVVGEFLDLLQDLSFEESPDTIEDIEIDLSEKGKWRWIREEENNEMYARLNAPPKPVESTSEISSSSQKHIEIVTLDSDDDEENEDADDNDGGRQNEAPVTANSIGVDTDVHGDIFAELDTLIDDTLNDASPNAHDNHQADDAGDGLGVNTENPVGIKDSNNINDANNTSGDTHADISVVNTNTHHGSNVHLYPEYPASYRGAFATPTSTQSNPVINHINNPVIISTPPPHIPRLPHRSPKYPPNYCQSHLTGFITHVNNPHKGVVAFRPGPFVSSPPPKKPATSDPVFMTGEGAEDDPIVLD